MLSEVSRETDRHEIVDLTYRYASSIDLKDEALLVSCLASMVEASGSGPGPMGSGLAAGMLGSSGPVAGSAWAAQIIAGMRRMGATQHLFSNHRTTFSDETSATCRFYMRAMHFPVGRATAGPYEVGGFYEDDMVKVDGEWRIAFWRLHLSWEYGDYAVILGGDSA